MGRSLIAVFLLLGGLSVAQAETYQTQRLAEDGIHDPENDAVKVLQEPGESMIDFPMDRLGLVNWVTALRDNKINPRKSRSGEGNDGETMQELDMDVIMKQTANMPNVRFPHLAHTQWLACSNCHPKIFIPQKEANDVSMDKIFKGQFCGRCHDKVAFSLLTCERCHSVKHETSGKAYVKGLDE